MDEFVIKSNKSVKEVEEGLDLIRKLLDNLGVSHMFLAAFNNEEGEAVLQAKTELTDGELKKMMLASATKDPRLKVVFLSVAQDIITENYK